MFREIGRKINIAQNNLNILIGGNGTGKTTAISEFIKNSKEIIGYLPQNFSEISAFPITVIEFLTFTNSNLEIIETWLEFFEMKQFGGSLIGNLSGGEKQKVFIIRALICQGISTLVLDEPDNNLDNKSIEKLGEMIVNHVLEKKITVIIISHNLILETLFEENKRMENLINTINF